MNITISEDALELGEEAAKFLTEKINGTVRKNGEARLVVSTGNSQFEMLQALIKKDIPWHKVEVFHLDEYIGIPVTHKASFRKYLFERFINLVNVKEFHGVDTEGDINKKIKELTELIRIRPIDVGIIGIGVNGHIAFNDPPADFDTHEAYITVNLDDQCKMQQVNEGWFDSIEDVPDQAVSMSVWQIMQCETIVSCVPHKVKADAVYKTLTNKLTNLVPATKLKEHNDFHLFLDKNSAAEIIDF